MTNPAPNPTFDPKAFHVQVRDRKKANVAFHQGDGYFDRAGKFVERAPITLIAPPKPEVKIKDITQIRERSVRGNKSAVEPMSAERIKAGRLSRVLKVGSVPDVVEKAHRENRRAAAVEEAAD